MNIACYSHYFAPEIGAPSARIYDLSQQWLTMGHHVHVITCFPNHPVGKLYPGYSRGLYVSEKLKGIRVHRHWTYITPNKGFLKKILGHISYLPSSIVFSNPHVKNLNIAIGTSPTLFAAMAAAWMGWQEKIPFVMEVRDLWPAIFVELGVLQNRFLINLCELFEIYLYRRATKIVTVTEAFRQNLIARGIAADKVVTIPNGADTEYWKPDAVGRDQKAYPEFKDKFIVLYIGAHGISHALSRIIDVADRLRDRSEILFLFVGDGAEKKRLQKKASTMGLNNVRFRNPVDKEGVCRYYQLADICLVPLRNLPLFTTFIPSKIFEIMAMSKPMVASLEGEAADIVHHSDGGIVVKPEDTDQIANAIIDLYLNPEKRQKMGIAARKFVSTQYDRKTLASQYINCLKDTISTFRHGVN